MRDNHEVDAHREVISLAANGFAKPAFHTIPIHSIPNFSADGEPHPGLVGAVADEQNHQQPLPNPIPSALHALDID